MPLFAEQNSDIDARKINFMSYYDKSQVKLKNRFSLDSLANQISYQSIEKALRGIRL